MYMLDNPKDLDGPLKMCGRVHAYPTFPKSYMARKAGGGGGVGLGMGF